MKKLFVLLLALACVGFAFAEDAKPALTFGQYTDVSATYADTFDYDIYNETYLNFKAADMGMSATVVSGADLFAEPRNFKIYYNLFEGKLQIAAGKLREGTGRLTTYIEGNGLSTRFANVEKGIILTAKPIDGLTAAAFIPVYNLEIGEDLKQANFGLSYAVPDLLTIAASYRMSDSSTGSSGLAGIQAEAAAGVDVKAIPDMTLKAGFRWLEDVGSYIYVTGGSDKLVENLNVGFDADVFLRDGGDMGIGVEGLVDYAIDKLNVGAEFGWDNADAWFKNDGIRVAPYAMLNFDKGDIKVSFDYAGSDWSVPIEFELSY